MRYGNPISSVANAVVKALGYDLPDVEEVWRGKSVWRRPNDMICTVDLWQQGFANTALMFNRGGIAGQAMCSADVVVVSDGQTAAVYCCEDLAYIAKDTSDFRELCRSQTLPGQSTVGAYDWFIGYKGDRDLYRRAATDKSAVTAE